MEDQEMFVLCRQPEEERNFHERRHGPWQRLLPCRQHHQQLHDFQPHAFWSKPKTGHQNDQRPLGPERQWQAHELRNNIEDNQHIWRGSDSGEPQYLQILQQREDEPQQPFAGLHGEHVHMVVPAWQRLTYREPASYRDEDNEDDNENDSDDEDHGDKYDYSRTINDEDTRDAMNVALAEDEEAFGHERHKRKCFEVEAAVNAASDSDEEVFFPSCKRQRITLEAVEQLFASFSISKSNTTLRPSAAHPNVFSRKILMDSNKTHVDASCDENIPESTSTSDPVTKPINIDNKKPSTLEQENKHFSNNITKDVSQGVTATKFPDEAGTDYGNGAEVDRSHVDDPKEGNLADPSEVPNNNDQRKDNISTEIAKRKITMNSEEASHYNQANCNDQEKNRLCNSEVDGYKSAPDVNCTYVSGLLIEENRKECTSNSTSEGSDHKIVAEKLKTAEKLPEKIKNSNTRTRSVSDAEAAKRVIVESCDAANIISSGQLKTSHWDTNNTDAVNNNSKRCADEEINSGGATVQGHALKRVRKLKSGLRLCSNITCYIEQVLYNC
ncbi:MATH and LRR domain-containing protein PFE0570w [Hyalella azteca]|uniref:MATH and LRR domain-containing protein PFE0570w n=1 Tax=Hyalella azteca TaxID=294128 RepID=A0A8B7PPR4_HYAAZ|nr:MATH and LRR domain-containing protein PFE0570w [Hyalella azteca]